MYCIFISPLKRILFVTRSSFEDFLISSGVFKEKVNLQFSYLFLFYFLFHIYSSLISCVLCLINRIAFRTPIFNSVFAFSTGIFTSFFLFLQFHFSHFSLHLPCFYFSFLLLSHLNLIFVYRNYYFFIRCSNCIMNGMLLTDQ